MLGGSKVYNGIGGTLIALAGIVLGVLLCIERKIIRKIKILVFEEEEQRISIILDQDAYRHPCEPNEDQINQESL